MLRVTLLGKCHIIRDGNEVASFVSTKAQALLVYLLVTRQRHSRHALAGLFWAEDPEKKAKNSLRVALSNINKLLPGYLETDRLNVSLAADQPIWLDTDDFVPDLDTATTSTLEEAAALYRGDYMADFFIEGAPEFEEWLLTQRAAWRQQALNLLKTLAARHMAGRRYDVASVTLRRLLVLEPWEEAAHRQLMLALSRQGEFNAAIAQYETCQRLLDEELGLEPMPETTALYDRVLQARERPIDRLPTEATPLVGRVEELNRLHVMLEDPACRLITITGLGGMGKTRLALAAARQAAHEQAVTFLNGIAFVPLAGVEEARDVPQAVAAALDVPLTGMVEARLAMLKHLRDRELLLVLDNFEHLMDATAFLEELFASCPDVKLIVSSREPLHLGAEWRLDLKGLPYPPPDAQIGADDLLAYDAVKLFVQAGRQVRPDFDLTGESATVARLCHLVAGMPLALKLAATWLRSMTSVRVVASVERNLDLLSTEMRDVPPRQRSMRAVFDSTWSLLGHREREVLQALSIFRGGFSEEAATAVAGASHATLANLIDRGLVQFGDEGRYGVHELTRQYAASKLEASGLLTDTADRHSNYYLDLAARQEKELHGDTPQVAVGRLRRGLDNTRASWDYAVEQGHIDYLLAATEALATFFEVSGLDHEGQETFAQAADRFIEASTTAEQQLRCGLILAQCRFADVIGTYEMAEVLLGEAITLAQESGSQEYLADGFRIRGTIFSATGRHVEAREDQEAALNLYQDLGNRRLEATTLSDLGWTCIMDEAYDKALAHLALSLELFATLPDKRGLSFALGNKAVAHAYKGELEKALDYTWQVLAINEEIDYPLGVARMRNNIGLTYVWMGRYNEALSHLETALAMHRKISALAEIGRTAESLASAYISLGRNDKALPLLDESLSFAEASRYTYLDCSVRIQTIRHYLQTGEYSRIETHMQRLKEQAEAMANPMLLAQATLAEGKLAAETGERRRAVALTQETLALIGEMDQPIELAPAHLHLATLLHDQRRPAEAEIQLKSARAAASFLNHGPLLCQCEALAASVALAQGRTAAAASHAEEALRWLGQIDAGPEAMSALYRIGRYFLASDATDEARLALAHVADHNAAEYGTRHLAQTCLAEIDDEEASRDSSTPGRKLEEVLTALSERLA